MSTSRFALVRVANFPAIRGVEWPWLADERSTSSSEASASYGSRRQLVASCTTRSAPRAGSDDKRQRNRIRDIRKSLAPQGWKSVGRINMEG